MEIYFLFTFFFFFTFSVNKKKPGPPTRPKPKKDKEPVQVYCRLRPPKNTSDLIVVRKVPNSDELLELIPPSAGFTKQTYKFKLVFDEFATQKDVFDNVAFPLVKDLISGQNGLFVYFQKKNSLLNSTICI